MRYCTIDGCNAKHYGRGYCSKHYTRWRIHGDLELVKYEYHGATNSSEYKIWQGIKKRCYNTACANYEYYGGRGITMADEWRKSYKSFIAHIGPRPSKKHSVDRINPDGNYEPGNVRWVTASTQNINQRRTSPHPRIYRMTNRHETTWLVLIIKDKKRLINNRFKTLEAAIEARDAVLYKYNIV